MAIKMAGNGVPESCCDAAVFIKINYYYVDYLIIM